MQQITKHGTKNGIEYYLDKIPAQEYKVDTVWQICTGGLSYEKWLRRKAEHMQFIVRLVGADGGVVWATVDCLEEKNIYVSVVVLEKEELPNYRDWRKLKEVPDVVKQALRKLEIIV
jgi:hypothetical protein